MRCAISVRNVPTWQRQDVSVRHVLDRNLRFACRPPPLARSCSSRLPVYWLFVGWRRGEEPRFDAACSTQVALTPPLERFVNDGVERRNREISAITGDFSASSFPQRRDTPSSSSILLPNGWARNVLRTPGLEEVNRCHSGGLCCHASVCSDTDAADGRRGAGRSYRRS